MVKRARTGRKPVLDFDAAKRIRRAYRSFPHPTINSLADKHRVAPHVIWKVVNGVGCYHPNELKRMKKRETHERSGK